MPSARRPAHRGQPRLAHESVVERTVKAMHPPAPPVPMGVDGMMALWSTLTKMQSDTRRETMEMAAMLQGRELPEPDEKPEESPLSAALSAVLPGLIEALRKPSAPPPAPPGPAPSLPYQEPGKEPAAMQINVPMTSNEQAKFALSVAMSTVYRDHRGSDQPLTGKTWPRNW